MDEGIIRFFDPVDPEFDRDFADASQVIGGVDYSLDVRRKFVIGQDTPVYAHSGRSLVKLKAANGSQVFIRNAQIAMLDGNKVQITFDRSEQAGDLLPAHDEYYEDDPVFVLWEGGGIEEFKNEDDARDEIMAMESRGCKHMMFDSREEAESALKAMASVFNKNNESSNNA